MISHSRLLTARIEKLTTRIKHRPGESDNSVRRISASPNFATCKLENITQIGIES